MFKKALLALFSLCLLASAPATAELSQGRFAGDKRVNSTMSSAQERPAVTIVDGGWVAAWQSREGTADLEIRAQVTTNTFTSNEILVNDSSAGTQTQPDVASDANGNFAVVWYSNEPVGAAGDDSGFGIVARLFNANGAPKSPAFQVNTVMDGNQMHPAISMRPDGSFAIAWRSNSSLGTDDSGSSIQVRVFDPKGKPLTNDFQANVYTSFNQHYPDIAYAPNGNFTVVWQSLLQDGSIDGIYARRFDAFGTPVTGERQVNVDTLGAQSFPSIATASGGRTLIVWESETDQDDLEIRARLFNTSFQALGGEIEVNMMKDGTQSLPDVSTLNTGFLVAWQSEVTQGDDAEGYSIQVRPLDFNALSNEPELQLNISTSGNQEHVAVASRGDYMAAVWDSDHVQSNEEDVYIFENGGNTTNFEDGKK